MSKKMAFERIKDMDDESLAEYVSTLEQDLLVKQTKAKRLGKDIERHETILAAARHEWSSRGARVSAYKGLE